MTDAKIKQATVKVTRRQARTKFPGKTATTSVALTRLASDKLDNRGGEFRFLSVSDTVEQVGRGIHRRFVVDKAASSGIHNENPVLHLDEQISVNEMIRKSW